MDKVLKLYYVEGGVSGVPFPNAEDQIEIGTFRYDAKRMGGAPIITASVNYPTCLDDKWTDEVYTEFNGEKFYLKQIPTSSYDNADVMYKHDLELVSERIVLDNVYFFDVVTGNPMDSDKPVSNSTKVVFFGGVREFAKRLQASIDYSGLDYTITVDDNVTTEEKLMSFEDQFLSNVLQEIYNTYKEPYYFDGKTIHIGEYKKLSAQDELPVFSYGVDNALLSITKNNANYKIVNRATGTGSSDNIPFYYPNNSPKGNIKAVSSRSGLTVNIIDGNKFANKVGLDDSVRYDGLTYSAGTVTCDGQAYTSGSILQINNVGVSKAREFEFPFTAASSGVLYLNLKSIVSNIKHPNIYGELPQDTIESKISLKLFFVRSSGEKEEVYLGEKEVPSTSLIKVPITEPRDYVLLINVTLAIPKGDTNLSCDLALSYEHYTASRWLYDGKEVKLKDLGLTISGTPMGGDTITQKLIEYINTSKILMPTKYRTSKGADRFYNATSEECDGWIFNNPYKEGNPKEHIIKVDDIKPSIEGMKVGNQRIDMFEDFAYDLDDNDETYEDEEGNVYFKHPYFFAKLKPLGFNLFDHAIEQQPMVISFTSGDCGACSFEIAVDEDTQKNTVQVEGGYVKYDENGRVLCGAEGSGQGEVQPQDIQQDTTNQSVWIALRKEEQTYGILMPKAPIKDEQGNEIGGHRPSTEDTFVILGINLPQSYIINAEQRLEAEIIKYLKENNDEKFTFSINFSRIFFAEEENKYILDHLDENSKIRIAYDVYENEVDENGNPKEKIYDLYVSSFSYSMSEDSPLPEIRVELNDTLKITQNALQNAINEVKSQLGKAFEDLDILGVVEPHFIRKNADDEARGIINFTKGVKFGEGGKVEILDDNSAKLTIEYLEVTKKSSFTSIEIQEKTHVGGQILVSPAAITCGEVEETSTSYRCYFQTKDADGEKIFNQFVEGDQAICQTFNSWGSQYYWRLVTGVGDDYIDLSKSDCDEYSGRPSEGDKIIQLGNRYDEKRQNAIVIAAYGDGSPYIIQYKGINSFEITEENVVTKLSSTENIFTGKVHMELGSDIIGGSNMLRNSGFTGDYLSAPLADEQVLEEAAEMFNPPLIYWNDPDNPAVGASVQDSAVSVSGKELALVNGHVIQSLYQRVISGETYVISFKAKGILISENTDEMTGEVTRVYSAANATFGGETTTIELTDGWKYYATKVVAKNTSNYFSIASSNATICDLQLERGSVATDWGRSFLDNSSDRVYYQASKYLQDALKGFTDIYGGLLLTGLIKVGLQENDVMVKETAGMSGQYHNDNDVAFWAGGSEEQAKNALAQTGEDEANFAVSHGGKVVMNDAVVRGTIYADDGVFGGFIKKRVTEVDNLNVNNIAPLKNGYRTITPKTAGSLMYLMSSLTMPVDFCLPHLWKGEVYDHTNSGYTATDIREMIGSEIVIYNLSSTFSKVCGYSFNEESKEFNTALSCATEGAMNPNEFCHAVCKLDIDSNGYEVIYWKLMKGVFAIN